MISLNAIHLSLGHKPVLRGVDLNIQDGECLAVVGPNGCGKSSMLKVIVGDLKPDSGEVRIPNRMTVGYLPQEADLDAAHPPGGGTARRVFRGAVGDGRDAGARAAHGRDGSGFGRA